MVSAATSGTIRHLTRRYHGLLVAALPTPFGRTMMFNHVGETLRRPDGRVASVYTVTATPEGKEFGTTRYLTGFHLEAGLPVWTYDVEGTCFEKRVLMPHLQNTTHITYRLPSEPVRLELRPFVAFRLQGSAREPSRDGALSCRRSAIGSRSLRGDLPPLRLFLGRRRRQGFAAETFGPATDGPLSSIAHECCGNSGALGYLRFNSPGRPGHACRVDRVGDNRRVEPDELPHAEYRRRAVSPSRRSVCRQPMAAELVLGSRPVHHHARRTCRGSRPCARVG
jgi:hypothetical protein